MGPAEAREDLRKLSARFAISARQYADAAARFGRFVRLPADHVRMVGEIESARQRAELDFAALRVRITGRAV